MSSIIKWFMADDLKANGSALSATLQQDLDGAGIGARIFEINSLKETQPDEAQEKIAKCNEAYYKNKQSVIRTKSDLNQHYNSFFQSKSSKTTWVLGLGVGVLSYVVDAWMMVEVPEGCPEQEAMFSIMTQSIGLCMTTLGLQALHHYNYQNEAKQLNDKVHNHHQQAEFFKVILEGVGEEQLLEEEPPVDAKVFQAY